MFGKEPLSFGDYFSVDFVVSNLESPENVHYAIHVMQSISIIGSRVNLRNIGERSVRLQVFKNN
ncbi:CLUMA_CG008818, isoform A [Clunio marinus]|uniref:CLUMA_CG008818, isoform A n=1 Tax=Clunio marinus TaxID=568069 RepID=A0A1J1I6Z1_9DIPT|nr:CLUMA_CG008818, isoform A [Clunio marinus]